MQTQPNSDTKCKDECRARLQEELIINCLKRYPNPNTQRVYKNALNSLFRFTQVLIFDLTSGNIEQWIDYLRNNGLKESTISAWLAAVSSLFNYLLDCQAKGYELGIVTNPVIAVERPTIARYNMIDALDWDQLRAYVKELYKRIETGPRKPIHFRDGGLNLLLILTGKRLNEIRLLRWGQIHLFQGKPKVQWNSEREYDKLDEIPQPAWVMIRAYLELSGRLPQMQTNDYIFVGLESPFNRQTNDYSNPLDERTIRSSIKSYADRANLKNITVKTLRHTYAALMADVGASPQVLRRQLGLASLSETRHYMYHLMNSVDHNRHWKTIAETLGLPSESDDPLKNPTANGSKKPKYLRLPRK